MSIVLFFGLSVSSPDASGEDSSSDDSEAGFFLATTAFFAGGASDSDPDSSSEDDWALTGAFLAWMGLADAFDWGLAAGAFFLGGGASSSELDSSSDELSGTFDLAATAFGAGYFFGAGFFTSSSDDDSSSLEDYCFSTIFKGFFATTVGALPTGFLVDYEAGDLTETGTFFLLTGAASCLPFTTALPFGWATGCFLGGGASSDSLSYSPLELEGSTTFFLPTALL